MIQEIRLMLYQAVITTDNDGIGYFELANVYA